MRVRRSGRLAASYLSAVVLAATVVAPSSSATAQQGRLPEDGPPTRDVAYTSWSSPVELRRGESDGTVTRGAGITLGQPAGTRDYADPFGDDPARTYEYGTWTSPVVTPGFDLTEAIASWSARTPGGSWIEVELRGRTDQGSMSKWYVLGRWAEKDTDLHRTSLGGQGDDVGRVAIDTFKAAEGRTLENWQLRVTLLRPEGSRVWPSVRAVGAMASALQATEAIEEPSPSGGAEGIVLDVPTYSQETHIGHYPQWDNGGEAWCSPTSTSMVMRYWGAGPSPDDYSWVDPAEDPWVDHAARGTFDYNYDGAGNWPFNTAYAARYGLDSFVTRLRSLTEAEQFIKAGIPLVVSMSFEEDELDGAGYGTNGHLMVIVGFDENGDVVANDPASHLIPSNDEVRVTYDRQQFESAWLPHSGGITYVMRPESVPLPSAPAQANW